MRETGDLKRETDALLEAEREQRLDREARDRRDGSILDAFDRLQSGRPLASEREPPPRHPPHLFDVSELDDQDDGPCSHVFNGDRCDRCGAEYAPVAHGHRIVPEDGTW